MRPFLIAVMGTLAIYGIAKLIFDPFTKWLRRRKR
jgi:hypothetical protein